MENDEIIAIKKVVADAEALQNDLEGFTGLLTQDAAIVNFGGRRVQGKAEIYEIMKQALASPLAKVLTRNELIDIHFLRPDVALASSIKHVSDERDETSKGAGAPLRERGSLTFVLVKEQGRWLIAAAQTTPIMS